MNRQIPEKLLNFTAHKDGSKFLGMADVTLPSIEYLSETIKGAGIAGEIDSITPGHTSSMTVQLNWRTTSPEAIELLAPVSHSLDFRGSHQIQDLATGSPIFQQIKVSIRAKPKKMDLGKFEPFAATDTSNELEVTYLKVMIDNKVVMEIDKFNFIFIINGVDYLAEIRSHLGM